MADAAETGDPWVGRRADAKLFWRFLESFLMSLELMLKALSCIMRIYILCTGMPLKGAIRECGRKREDLVRENGVGALAYDKDLNGNMY